MNRAELKLEARNRLRHNWGWAGRIGTVMTQNGRAHLSGTEA